MQRDITVVCSFCNKKFGEVRKLIAGTTAFICDECVILSNEILKKDIEVEPNEIEDIKSPREVKAVLDKHIVGQEEAKRGMSVAIYNHYKMIQNPDKQFKKSNILMVGPSGCGKTLSVKTLSESYKLPIVVTDATSMSEVGYVGEDPSTPLVRLVEAAKGNIELAEKRGIIFIDEIDKIASEGNGNSFTRDVSGKGVQTGLLKIMEGSEVRIPAYGKRGRSNDMETINTTNILFIFSGAFGSVNRPNAKAGEYGLGEIIKSRMNLNSMGFQNQYASTKKIDEKKILKFLAPEDLIKFGFIKEFISRIEIYLPFFELTKEEMRLVLKNEIYDIATEMKLGGVEIDVTDSGMNEILDIIHKENGYSKYGAREIRMVMNKVLLPDKFNLLGTESSLMIDSQYIKDRYNELHS